MCCRWNTPCCATVHDRRVMTHGSGGNEFQRRVHVELVCIEHGSIPQWGFSEKEQVCIRYTEYLSSFWERKSCMFIPGSLCCYYGTGTHALYHQVSGLSSQARIFLFFFRNSRLGSIWSDVEFDSLYVTHNIYCMYIVPPQNGLCSVGPGTSTRVLDCG